MAIAVQGADVDAYDLIPTVPSWKAPETPLEINVGDSQDAEDGTQGTDDAQVHWPQSTAAEMRSPIGKLVEPWPMLIPQRMSERARARGSVA